MRSKLRVLLVLLLALLFSSCQTINSRTAELGITQKTVYLSFDDGPDAETTPELLDVLGRHRVKAIFCLLGVNGEQYPDLIRQIHDGGHVIINHGYSDKFAVRMKEGEFRDNLIMGEEVISSALGFDMEPRLYRPQGGFYKSQEERIWKDEGFCMLPVTIRAHDAALTSAMQKNVARKIAHGVIRKNGGLVLLHDARESWLRKDSKLEKYPNGSFNRSWIPQTVEDIITELLGKGFVFPNPDAFIRELLTGNDPLFTADPVREYS